MGIRIDALDAVASAQADHEFPVMRAGQTFKVTGQQLATFIVALVTDSAPSTLDTLNELAAALGDDPNFATTVTNALAGKADASTAATLVGAQTLTNKTLTAPILNAPQLTLVQSTAPTPAAEGRVEWDTNDDRIVVGTGSGQAFFGQVTPWMSYTPTISNFGTVSAVVARSRRVGGSLEVHGRFTGGTGSAATGTMQLGFNGSSGGLAISSALNSARTVVGPAAFSYVGPAPGFVLALGGEDNVKFGQQTATRAGMTPADGSALLTSGDSMSFSFSVPIEGWQ